MVAKAKKTTDALAKVLEMVREAKEKSLRAELMKILVGGYGAKAAREALAALTVEEVRVALREYAACGYVDAIKTLEAE